MNLKYYSQRPILSIKLVFYYFFGNTVGRVCYSSFIYKSQHLKSIVSIGWEWIFKCFFWQKIIGINKNVPWPVSFRTIITCPENIVFHPDDLNNFMTGGNYFQALGAKLIIGRGTFIAPNVGLITQNHDIENPDKRSEGKAVILGDNCWIGMNSMILPGVNLGPHTIVGAGSVVTKSFPKGSCVIAGNPAKIIRYINTLEIQKVEE